jgi:hypothetical protein
VTSTQSGVPSLRRCTISKVQLPPSSSVRCTFSRPASTSCDTRSIEEPMKSSRGMPYMAHARGFTSSTSSLSGVMMTMASCEFSKRPR